MKCFKCDRTLDPVDPKWERQPYGGTVFVAYGHYGSTVWDVNYGSSNKFLEIVLCDDCLLANKDQVQMVRKIPRVDYEYKAWDPENDG